MGSRENSTELVRSLGRERGFGRSHFEPSQLFADCGGDDLSKLRRHSISKLQLAFSATAADVKIVWECHQSL